MLEEARVQTVSHALTLEFQRQIGDRRMGRYFLASKKMLLLVCSSADMEVVKKSCRRQGVLTMVWLL